MINIEDLFDKNYEHNSIVMNAKNYILDRVNVPLYAGRESLDEAKKYAECKIQQFQHDALVLLLTEGYVYTYKFYSDTLERVEFMKVYPATLDDVGNKTYFGIAHPSIDDKYKNRLNLIYSDEWPANIITIIPNTKSIGTLFHATTPLGADLQTMLFSYSDAGSHDKIAFAYDKYNNELKAQILFTVAFKDGPITILRVK